MKQRKIMVRLCCLLLLLSLLPMGVFAADKPPSQAGTRKLEGGQRDFIWPVPGEYHLSSCFLDNREHYSLDISAPMGKKIVASYGGTVIDIFTGCEHNWGKRGSCCSSWGNYVLLEHSYQLKSGEIITLYSRYAHLTKVSVKVGQRVVKGEKIGTNGSTGNSTGPHLDYEILYGGKSPSKKYSVDPYINDLLELPDELYTTFGQCCRDYVAYVKKIYPQCTHDHFDKNGYCTDCGYAYDWKTTRDIDALGYYKVNEQVTAFAIPYPQDEGTALEAQSTVSVAASLVNGLGQEWYEVSLEDGKVGYVPKKALTFQSYFASRIGGVLSTLEDGQVLPQASHRLDGTITSRYPIRSIVGYLDGEKYASWSGTGSIREMSLRGTKLNKNLNFAKLSPGEHTLTITATDVTGREAMQIISCTFVIKKTQKTFTVTFVTEPEKTLLTLEEGKPLGELPVLMLEDKNFLGWFTEGGQQVTAQTVPLGDMTLLPRWEDIIYEEIPEETQPTTPEISEPATQATIAPKTEEQPKKPNLWWLFPVAVVVLGGIAGVVRWLVKKKLLALIK